MGLFGDILNGIGLGYEIHKDQHLTGSQREANQFSADQAELNRNFQAGQAEIARDWQEQQYLKYNSPSAQVAQYQAAGINPATMYGQSFTPASSSTSAPTGSAASSVSPPGGDVVGMIGQLMELSMLGERKESLKLQNENQRLDNEIKSEMGMITAHANYDKINQEIQNLIAQENLDVDELNYVRALDKALKKAQERNLNAEAAYNEWRETYIKDYGADPSAPLDRQFMSSILKDLNDPERRSRRKDNERKKVSWRADSMTD